MNTFPMQFSIMFLFDLKIIFEVSNGDNIIFLMYLNILYSLVMMIYSYISTFFSINSYFLTLDFCFFCYNCKNCNFTSDRDLNGAKNIFLKPENFLMNQCKYKLMLQNK